jgi:hypothetical protein
VVGHSTGRSGNRVTPPPVVVSVSVFPKRDN